MNSLVTIVLISSCTVSSAVVAAMILLRWYGFVALIGSGIKLKITCWSQYDDLVLSVVQYLFGGTLMW